MLQHAEGLAHPFSFIGIAACVQESFDKLGESRWQGDSHALRVDVAAVFVESLDRLPKP